MRLLLTTIFLLITLFSTRLQGQNQIASTGVSMDSLDQFIERNMRQSGLVGIGAALIIDKEVVWTKGYGYADKANRIAFTPNTIMNVWCSYRLTRTIKLYL